MSKAIQYSLFGEEYAKPSVNKTKSGGSSNPIVFRDYESYVAKFSKKEKTTDDTYTPKDVYEAVVDYVRSIYDIDGKVILRPFYPGGDYEKAEYPENGVVIDNPPFSLFTKICQFYSSADIPFFLFGPGLTITSALKYCSVVIISPQITFENGAVVRCNFATNLIGDIAITTAVRLGNAISLCDSQNKKANLPKYAYPDEVLSVSDFQTIASRNEDFSLMRNEIQVIRKLDCHPKGSLFGDHIITTEAAAQKAAAQKAATQKAAAQNVIKIELSDRERKIVERLGKNDN